MLVADATNCRSHEIAEMGQVIYDSGKRLERLIENFLIYAQLELLGSDPQKLHSLLCEAIPSPPPASSRSRRATRRKPPSAPNDLKLELADVPVPVSEEYLTKIVDELVQNAFKFSPANSPVRVALTNDSPDHVTLTIADHGRGLSTEHVAKIGAYMQFDRKMHEQQGIGLGLTICKRLTEMHGGTLTIQSSQTDGTTITLKLPKIGDS